MLGTQTWEALGTAVRVVVSDGDIEAASRAVSDLVDEVDRTYSRFRPDSELSLVNAHATETVTLSPLLALATETALRGARLTDGLVDPTVGRHMRLIGYDDDFAIIHGRTDRIVLRLEPVAGWRALQWDVARRALRLPRGVELDLGSTGKALAADLAAAAALRVIRHGGVLVSLGGDIAVAGEPPEGGWNVLVAEDSRTPTDGPGESIAIRDGAIATSSTTVRRWTRDGVNLHHILDPRTGLPAAAHWRTVSVTAATCVDANIAATAAVIRGADAPEWLSSLGLAARLVSEDGDVVRVGGWPAPLAAAAA
jgi:FAD:protein FMN transferase